MKILEIKSCEQCFYMSKQTNGNRCLWPHKLPMRNLRRIMTFPYWCPLPDVPQQDASQPTGKTDAGGRAYH